MSATAALADEAMAALTELRAAAARIGSDRDALLVLARAQRTAAAIWEQQRAHDALVAEAIAVADRAAASGYAASPRSPRPASRRDRRGLRVVTAAES